MLVAAYFVGPKLQIDAASTRRPHCASESLAIWRDYLR